MPAALYLSTLAALTCKNASDEIHGLLMYGQLEAALRKATLDEQAGAYGLTQLRGDLLLATGKPEAAERAYGEALRRAKDTPSGPYVQSCRIAAWQSLLRGRMGPALSGFGRIADETDLPAEQRAEALVGLCTCFVAQGNPKAALSVIGELRLLQSRLADARWLSLIAALDLDVRAQVSLRASAEFADHIHWQGGEAHGLHTASPSQAQAPGQAQEGTPLVPVLEARCTYLLHLVDWIRGAAHAWSLVNRHAQWSRRANCPQYATTVDLELCFAALARGASALAKELLFEATQAHPRRLKPSAHRIEQLYCAYKLYVQQGQAQSAHHFYRLYAAEALHHACTESCAIVPAVARHLDELLQAPTDELASALPGRYQQAYRYLVQHAHEPDLSVCEVADEIGVSARALQLAFKTHLGMTPRQLIRRLRCEAVEAASSTSKRAARASHATAIDSRGNACFA